jgi:hypothetical protein
MSNPNKPSTQRKLVLGRDEFQAVLAAAYLLQQNRDRLPVKEPGVNYTRVSRNSLESAQPIQEAAPIAETTKPFTEGAGLDQRSRKWHRPAYWSESESPKNNSSGQRCWAPQCWW